MWTTGNRFASRVPPEPGWQRRPLWDEGLGEGWPPDALYLLSEQEARDLLLGPEGTVPLTTAHYRGQVRAWVVANEVTDGRRKDANGFWTVNPATPRSPTSTSATST